jgi:hypothetical protein
MRYSEFEDALLASNPASNANKSGTKEHPMNPRALILALAAATFSGAGEPYSPSASHPWPVSNAALVQQFSEELKGVFPEFTIHIIGPWVIATDLPANKSEHFLEGTIATYAAQIQRQLFRKQARSKPAKVLLFKDRNSYERGCKKLFAKMPDTPYGFYSRLHNSLAMNIGTGGGTLLHEMVHAMAEEDFPTIPAWLNEGLGSLYEASDMRENGTVIGVKNWRYNELLPAINGKYATSLENLLKQTDNEFYGPNSTLNYAVSRYLMQYLQEEGKLETFYTRIRDRTDPNPAATLKAIFGNQSLDQIESNYHKWIKKLE